MKECVIIDFKVARRVEFGLLTVNNLGRLLKLIEIVGVF